MAMTREQEHVVRELNARLSRVFVQGINRQPAAKMAQTISRLQEVFTAQEGIDPGQDIKAWFKPLRGFVDYLDDNL